MRLTAPLGSSSARYTGGSEALLVSLPGCAHFYHQLCDIAQVSNNGTQSGTGAYLLCHSGKKEYITILFLVNYIVWTQRLVDALKYCTSLSFSNIFFRMYVQVGLFQLHSGKDVPTCGR